MAKISLWQTKILGYILVVLCMPLLVFGLVEYLFTAYPSLETIERPYVRGVNLNGEKSFDLWYSLSESPIILNQSLHITIEVIDDEVIDFYVMPNSQYKNWKNGSIAMGIIEVQATNHEDLVFIPPREDKYYLILDNTPYNTSKSVQFQSIWMATVTLVNYSEAFNWLKISLIGLVLLIVGSLLSKNLVGLVLKKLQEFACLKEVKNVRGRKDIRIRIDLHSGFFWLALSLLTAIAFGAIMYSFARNFQFLQDFPELFPMVADIYIRMFLYYHFAFIGLSLFALFWLWLTGFLDDLDLLYLVKVKKLRWNRKLGPKPLQLLKEILSSSESVGYIIATLILFVAGCFLGGFHFPLFIGSTFVFSVAFSNAYFRSFRKSCDELKLKWTDELKREMPFAFNTVTIIILTIPVFLAILRIVFPVALGILDFFIIDSFAGPIFQVTFHETINPRTSFFEALNILTSDIILFGSLLFLLMTITTYYILPKMHRKLTIKSKLKLLVTPTVAALLAFVTNEIYFVWITPIYSGREEWSVLISLIAFGTSYLAGKAYEEAAR